MEELFKIQMDYYDTLEKALRNFKKSPKERLTKNYAEARLQSAETLFIEFKEVHRRIAVKATNEMKLTQEYFKSELYQLFENVFCDYKGALNDLIEQYKPQPLQQPAPLPSTSSSYDIQLPRINIPNFTGKYDEFPTFHDLFVTLIHKNKNLSGVQKLQHLKSCLVGEPENLLRNLTTTENNYEEAWNQLLKRYNNKRYNCNQIMKNLFSQKTMHAESSTAIKSLLDTTNSCLKSLQNLGINVKHWDAIVIYLVVSRLDVESHRQWEIKISELSPDQLPEWHQLTNFLESRFRSLEMIDTSRYITRPSPPVSTPRSTPIMKNIYTRPAIKPNSFHTTTIQDENPKSTSKCPMCSGVHFLFQCKDFAQKSPSERQEFIQTSRLCFNCFAPSHSVRFCRLANTCRRCGRRHHSLLHADNIERGNINQAYQAHTITAELENVEIETPTLDKSDITEMNIISQFSEQYLRPCNVLLATAKIRVDSKAGKRMLRALLDQGSQASFVTEETVQMLGLIKKSVSGNVSGIGEGVTRINHMVTIRVESYQRPDKSINVQAYVLKSLTSLLPAKQMSENLVKWVEYEKIALADPQFLSPGKIDILLGAEVYSEIILDGIKKNPLSTMLAQNTIFGWILSGRVTDNSIKDERVINMHVQIKEDYFLKKFWELEAEPNSIVKKQSKEEIKCEEIFDQTTERNHEGRFVVKLPFRDQNPACQYGQSRQIAYKRYELLERKLTKNPNLQKEYNDVIAEYKTLNHMQKIRDESELQDSRAVYLPHHAVVREDKETTKVRVVFDASCKGVNNVSLNDDLLTGPKLQQDLRHIVMRWRTHKICLVSDLVKMYRQVRVSDQDTRFQRILWRSNASSEIEHYKLLTLTFGTACAPYLAVKSIQRLAENVESQYPIAAKITKEDYYMDDLMTGCDTVEEGYKIYDEMNGLMNSGGFTLQKWSSNKEEILKYIHKDNHNENKTIAIKEDNLVKVLGINWNRESDMFIFKVNLPEVKEPITKRKVLSDIARLYDAMGWVAPVIVTAKIFIQKLWKANLPWDEHLQPDLRDEWLNFRSNLVHMDNIRIPRWIRYKRECDVELHAFADASKSAYAAVLYIKITDPENQIATVNLQTSKTKVAPIEKELSIPRLELCAALLAAKLLYEASEVLKIPRHKLFAWSDSTVVLAWLRGLPCRWTTFVSNRVSEILGILDCDQFRYINTSLNPADCASRGIQPQEMANQQLWWKGPPFLEDLSFEYPVSEFTTTEEERPIKVMTIIDETENEFTIINRFSKLSRMLRVLCYCRRWLKVKQNKDGNNKFEKIVTVEEIENMLTECIKRVQNNEFTEEIKNLKLQKTVSKKSTLFTLHPFLDKKGIVRVGGRIDQANIDYNTRHPIVIPAKTHLTRLLISEAHEKTLHGGPQTMLNFIRAKYWIIRARNQVKTYYRECVRCLRYSKAGAVQLMGQLPELRLKPTKPFKTSGVDFAGPIQMRFSPGRGSKSFKGYICLFICLVTRAIHLEAVSDLTAKGFIAAFRRFVSRRGHCKDLLSDNGTNFVGAEKILREMFDSAKSELPDEIKNLLTLEGTTWHFIPPHAPNFGGSWEAGVRSTKYHLKRVIGDSTLTFEELSTVLTQVEACLNSRPLTQNSGDPNDPLPLTPGHFLVGEPLINIMDVETQNVTGLNRWRMVQNMVTEFWKQWSKEYLVSLNQRYKWAKKAIEPEIGDIVIIREDHLPPAKWLLGKIINKFPGRDNLTRVVDIKCENSVLKRPVSKIVVLPRAN